MKFDIPAVYRTFEETLDGNAAGVKLANGRSALFDDDRIREDLAIDMAKQFDEPGYGEIA
jgi:hypothetical protein